MPWPDSILRYETFQVLTFHTSLCPGDGAVKHALHCVTTVSPCPPLILSGYWNNEAATQESFAPGGWFRTGDLATVAASGYISVVDRKKDMVRL